MPFAKSRYVNKSSPSIYKRHHFMRKAKILGYYHPSSLKVIYDDENIKFCSGEALIFTKEKPRGTAVVIPYDLLKRIPLPGDAGVQGTYAVYITGHVAEMERRYGSFTPWSFDVVVARRFNAISINVPIKSIQNTQSTQNTQNTKNSKNTPQINEPLKKNETDKEGEHGETDKESKDDETDKESEDEDSGDEEEEHEKKLTRKVN